MNDPLVSILIPTYNGERFLRPALRSAMSQSYRNLEILIGDDASTDGTPKILDAAAAEDPRVRVIRHETNMGAFGNPRRLFELAEGEYVKFVLHDDVLARDCVRDLLRGMQATPGATLSFSRRVLIDEEGRAIPGHEPPALADRPGPLDGRELGDAMLVNGANLVGELTTVLFRRDDVDSAWMWQVDGRQLEVLGDLSLHLRLLARGPAFYTPSVLSRFRQHGGQTSQDPGLFVRGVRDWPRLIDWATRTGYLSEEAQRRRALARALLSAALRAEQLAGGPMAGAALEAVHLATAALAEIAAGGATDGRPLTDRAHTEPVLGLFHHELDVWSQTLPVALAAPRVEATEIEATVQAFRDLVAAGKADKLVLAVAESQVDEAVPLIEGALARGTDVEVELVPSDDPARLLGGDWLAVAPRGATWHRGLATTVFSIDGVPDSGAA